MKIPESCLVPVLFAAALPLCAGGGTGFSVGAGFLDPGKQTLKETGYPDRELKVYQGGPAVDLAMHWMEDRWVGMRLRLTGFQLSKGDARLRSGGPVDAESYGLSLVFEGQFHLWTPSRPGPYLTLGVGGMHYRYAINGLLGTSARATGSDEGFTFSAGLGFQLGRGWEVEARADAHLTNEEVTVFPGLMLEVDPNPSGMVFLVRKRF